MESLAKNAPTYRLELRSLTNVFLFYPVIEFSSDSKEQKTNRARMGCQQGKIFPRARNAKSYKFGGKNERPEQECVHAFLAFRWMRGLVEENDVVSISSTRVRNRAAYSFSRLLLIKSQVFAARLRTQSPYFIRQPDATRNPNILLLFADPSCVLDADKRNM